MELGALRWAMSSEKIFKTFTEDVALALMQCIPDTIDKFQILIIRWIILENQSSIL